MVSVLITIPRYTPLVDQSRRHRIRRIPRAPSLLGLGAALVALAGFVVVPASLPLCTAAMEECGLVATAGAAPETRCTMDEAGLGGMPCCVEEAAPGDPQPVPPGKVDSGPRIQAEAPAPLLTASHGVLPGSAGPVLAPDAAAARTASTVPLYTLLSILLT